MVATSKKVARTYKRQMQNIDKRVDELQMSKYDMQKLADDSFNDAIAAVEKEAATLQDKK